MINLKEIIIKVNKLESKNRYSGLIMYLKEENSQMRTNRKVKINID